MGAVARWLVIGLACLAAIVGVLYVVVPPNETSAEGRADPILFLRRPVVRALIWTGALKGPGLFVDRYPHLPTTGGYEWSGPKTDPRGEDVQDGKVEVLKEPVYRGLLWLVGHRITYRRIQHGAPDGYCVIRLGYVAGSRRVVAAENPSPDPAAPRSEVSGFVPLAARGFWVECSDGKGNTRSDEWGDCDPE